MNTAGTGVAKKKSTKNHQRKGGGLMRLMGLAQLRAQDLYLIDRDRLSYKFTYHEQNLQIPKTLI